MFIRFKYKDNINKLWDNKSCDMIIDLYFYQDYMILA